jgi:predicted amidohydrolase
MKICIAQTRPVIGDIERNIEAHKVFVETAVSHHANFIIFPELSLTGYEPTLAQALAIQPDDPRLDVFQTMADAGQIMIGVGAPTQNQPRPCISLIIFQPQKPRQIYAKQYLHEDEEPFFVPGTPTSGLIGIKNEVALAICYEISVPEHATAACNNGASIYLASVAKFVNGIDTANKRLAEIAQRYAMTVFMVNCVGTADGAECAGQSAVWNPQGKRVGQLDDANEGILIFDTETQELTVEMMLRSGA